MGERERLLELAAGQNWGGERTRKWEAVTPRNMPRYMPRDMPRNSRGKRRHACTFATKETVKETAKESQSQPPSVKKREGKKCHSDYSREEGGLLRLYCCSWW